MASVCDVAKYILELTAANGEPQITTWKLQKLVYYSQAWSLVWDDEVLFDDRIEAWANGPVCPTLYNVHSGKFKISASGLTRGSSENLTLTQRETVDIVFSHYGKMSAHYLSELTHQEEPWKKAREGIPPGVRSNQEITQESMAEYYGGLTGGE